ncbi:MAG TPA: GAF domain-containing protein [Candidatus Nitrosotenuis sp.]|nr:GAF domain-containing protein [Candidatus Nitrosotenuis sp.]
MASSGVSGLLALTSLYNDAGSCDRLDDFLSVAAERARKATGSRECFVLYLGDQAQHLALSVSPGSPGVLSPLLQSVWSRKAPPAARLGQGPFQLEEILQEVRSDLEEEARSRSQSPPALVSIYHGEVPVGLAGLWEPEGYDSGIGETLSQALSVALTNYRLFAESRHHLARQSFLREVGGIFSTLGQLDEKVADFLARIELLRGVDAATLALVDPETGRLVPAGGSRIRADLHPFVEGLAREAAARSVLLHVEDLRQRGGPAGFLSYLGVPLKRRESVIGVLSILSRREKGFSRTDQEFFASLSEQVALNVENARLMEQTRQQLEELSFVFRVSTRLRQEKTLPGVMDVILEQCVRSINAQAGFLFFYEAEPGRLVPAAVFGSRAVELSALPLRGPGFDHAESLLKLRYCGRPRTDYPELFADPALSGLAADLPGWILIPLRTDRGLLGAVLIGHGPRPS